jgi:hypothetical protein
MERDADLIRRIGELISEEHVLHEQHHDGESLSPEEHQRLTDLEVALDQCWDLLRQRRARRAAGLEEEDAHVRPADIVERYQQ